jgi:hypothetical protein
MGIKVSVAVFLQSKNPVEKKQKQFKKLLKKHFKKKNSSLQLKRP